MSKDLKKYAVRVLSDAAVTMTNLYTDLSSVEVNQLKSILSHHHYKIRLALEEINEARRFLTHEVPS